MSNFNFVASFYDVLAKLIFGNTINRSNHELVKWVTPKSNVLILGGGTGELLKYFHSDISIDFVELSKNMVEKATQRKYSANLEFYNKDFLDFEPSKSYDYILCPYFLDLFIPSQLDLVLSKIKECLSSNGNLLVADFDPTETNLFNQLLHRMMIIFFRIASGIKIKRYNGLFIKLRDQGFIEIESFNLRSNFIQIKKYKF